MQSIVLAGRFFGRIRSSFTLAVLFVSTVLTGNAIAQSQPMPPPSVASVPDASTMTQDTGTPTALRELIQEAEQKNPQIMVSFHAWQASRVSVTSGLPKIC